MSLRNLYVKSLCNALKDKQLSSEERNSRVATLIRTIIAIKPFHDEFKRLNAGSVDPSEEASLNVADENGYTPLMIATYKEGNTENVRLLLEAKANPNTPNEKTGSTPLILVAQDGHTEIVRLLLAAEANPNAPNKQTGNTPLILALQYGHTEIVRLLLEAKANSNMSNEKTGNTPLTIAAKNGHTESVRLLLAAEANPNTPNGETGNTPLILAAQEGHTESVRLLLAAKAKPNTHNEKTGSTPLILAVSADDLESVRLLLEAKADIDYLDGNGESALDYAIEQNPLEAKADVDYLNRNDKSALGHAIEQTKLSIVLSLLQYSAKINNFEKICEFLSSQDQSDPCVVECLKILFINSKKAVAVVPVPMQKNEEFYLRKLTTLHNTSKTLFSYLINNSSCIPIPHVIALLIFDYNGFVKSGAHVPPMRFFKATTVDPHLDELKKEILETTGARLGFFNKTIEEIDKARALVVSSDVTPSSSSLS